MSSLTLSRKSMLPTWTNEFFEPGNFFGPSLLELKGGFPMPDFANRIPSVNIIENEKDFQIEMAAPGLEKKDFKVEMENGSISISVETKEETKDELKNYTRREYSFKSFCRTFLLPENCLPEKIDAKYENGVLRLHLPKKEVSVSKPVKEIKVL